jgi:hypothetical protein
MEEYGAEVKWWLQGENQRKFVQKNLLHFHEYPVKSPGIKSKTTQWEASGLTAWAMAWPQIVSMDLYTGTLSYLQLSLLTYVSLQNLYNFDVQWMCLQDVMHVCKLNENSSIAFFQYCEKTLILTANIEL